MLSLTKLGALVDRYPHQLSGGEQQRTCIARALIREPDLLLLDEPFSNLDAAIKNSIRDEIHNIIKTLQITTILVTHDIHDSLNISDKILVFNSGKLQQFDSPENVYTRPKNLYCANILGDVNKCVKPLKCGYIRPENINIVKDSSIKLIVKQCIFQGKEYRILGLLNKQNWTVYSNLPYEVNDELNLQFEENDLIEFN